MTRATPRQTTFFYITLRALVEGRIPPPDHLLRKIPIDPDQVGKTTIEWRAAVALQRAAGNWAYKLRQIWYSYCCSGYCVEAIHQCICYMTLYDDELRQLLRSHPDDEQLFPRVFCWNSGAEAAFMQKIRELDRQAS